MNPMLADAIFWIAVVSCAVAQIAILRSTFVARAGYATSPARRPATRLEEIVWAVAPAVALGTLLVFTWRAMHVR
jgi:heme/copper-type cytochrome/quinol oxidase subunit 2